MVYEIPQSRERIRGRDRYLQFNQEYPGDCYSASLSSNTSHRLAHATHAALLDGQRGSETSVRAIHDVVTSVRTGSPLVTQ